MGSHRLHGSSEIATTECCLRDYGPKPSSRYLIHAEYAPARAVGAIVALWVGVQSHVDVSVVESPSGSSSET